MIAGSGAGGERQWLERRKLDALLGYCESTRCRRQQLLANFGEDYPRPCGHCDNCLDPPPTWDGTEAARKALSCAYRSGQRFGVAHLVDILRGTRSERIVQLGHDQLSTFGVGADLDVRQWKSVFRQLVALGLLETDEEGHGSLRLCEASRPVLRGEQTLALREETPRKRERKAGRGPAPMRGVDSLPAADAPLFEALRALRAKLAREQNVPAYVIFHDATLRAIASQRPATLDELARIEGIGGRKLERYGEALLGMLDRQA
jgi:ATP-dependent DNA helicase RecQ